MGWQAEPREVIAQPRTSNQRMLIVSGHTGLMVDTHHDVYGIAGCDTVRNRRVYLINSDGAGHQLGRPHPCIEPADAHGNTAGDLCWWRVRCRGTSRYRGLTAPSPVALNDVALNDNVIPL